MREEADSRKVSRVDADVEASLERVSAARGPVESAGAMLKERVCVLDSTTLG